MAAMNEFLRFIETPEWPRLYRDLDRHLERKRAAAQ